MRENRFTKSTIRLIIGFFFLGSCLSAVRESDEISLKTPVDNQNISGITNISWMMKDADQTKIPVQIDLFNLSCVENGDYYGLITDNNELVSAVGNNMYSLDWDTTEPLTNRASVKDGNYCLRVCGVFLRDRNYYYSLCETRAISVENLNKAPKILSKPSKTNYVVGDEFVYQINAYDADNDTLSYKIIEGPSFITINSQTGLVKSTGKLAEAGSYTVRIRVQDPAGAKAEDVFNINVTKNTQNAVLTITSPTDKQVFKDSLVPIKWTMTDPSKVDGYVISYASDAKNWNKIVSVPASNTKVDWNVDTLPSGDYYVMVEAELNNTEIISATSSVFSIDKTSGAIPLIENLQPGENSVITDAKAPISASFYSPEGNKIVLDQVNLALDDVAQSDCIKTDNSIYCEQKSELSTGKHKVKLVVFDSQSKTNQKEWYFEVKPDNNNGGGTTGGFVFNTDTIIQVAQILCIGAVVIFVPWLLFIVIRRLLRNRTKTVQTVQTTTESTEPYPYQISDNDYSQYVVTPTSPVEVMQPVTADTTIPVDFVAEPMPVAGEYQTVDNNIALPSSYSNDEIPDWLKDVDASKPINASGGSFDDQFQNGESSANALSDQDSAMPHE